MGLGDKIGNKAEELKGKVGLRFDLLGFACRKQFSEHRQGVRTNVRQRVELHHTIGVVLVPHSRITSDPAIKQNEVGGRQTARED